MLSPDYPFQLVSRDFFNYAGKQNLLVVVRYSGCPVVELCRDGSASELVRMLRGYFGTYGVPKELASDGGMQYVAKSTQEFLQIWGIRHCVSRA